MAEEKKDGMKTEEPKDSKFAEKVQEETEAEAKARQEADARLRKIMIVEDPLVDTVTEIKDIQNVPNATTAVRMLRSALELYERRARMQETAQVIGGLLQQSKVRGNKIVTP